MPVAARRLKLLDRLTRHYFEMQTERSHTMGDKGGKKDKNKAQKQKVAKQEQQTQKKQEKQQKSTP
jgi:hypothetical protein